MWRSIQSQCVRSVRGLSVIIGGDVNSNNGQPMLAAAT
jgi:hypothetical protein